MVRAAVGISVVAMVMFSVFGASSSEPSSERISTPPQPMTAVTAKKASPKVTRSTDEDAGTLTLLTVLMLSGADPAEAADSIVAASE